MCNPKYVFFFAFSLLWFILFGINKSHKRINRNVTNQVESYEYVKKKKKKNSLLGGAGGKPFGNSIKLAPGVEEASLLD